MSEYTNHVMRKVQHYREVANYLADHADFIDSLTHANQAEPDDAWDTVTYMDWWESYQGITFTVRGPNAKKMVRQVRSTLGGTWDKRYVADELELTQEVSERLTIVIAVDREEVCTKKVTGTEIKRQRDPAKINALRTAMQDAINALPVEDISVDIVEYDCGSLAG